MNSLPCHFTRGERDPLLLHSICSLITLDADSSLRGHQNYIHFHALVTTFQLLRPHTANLPCFPFHSLLSSKYSFISSVAFFSASLLLHLLMLGVFCGCRPIQLNSLAAPQVVWLWGPGGLRWGMYGSVVLAECVFHVLALLSPLGDTNQVYICEFSPSVLKKSIVRAQNPCHDQSEEWMTKNYCMCWHPQAFLHD